ncbi:MAG: hypothetical protein R3B06_00505 [Kofleriaceae bacterium]
MNRLTTSVVVAAALAAGACTDLSQRWELDHARVLAVRLSSPGLAPGEAATVDALVSDATGTPALATPTLVAEVGASGAVAVAAAPGGWTVTAGDAAAIAAARTAAGLTADQPLDVTLGAQFVIDGVDLVATKRVRLGEAIANPPTPTIAVDGQVVTDAATISGVGTTTLTLGGVTLDDTLAVDWLTSTGALTNSETASATLELVAADPRTGHVVVLVKSDAGGAAWATVAVTAP